MTVDIKSITQVKNGDNQPIVDHCIRLFKKFEGSDYRKEKIDDIKEAYRVYRQKEQDDNRYWEGESKTVLPLLTITIDNLEPRLVAGLVGKAPVVNFEMDGLVEKTDQINIIEDWYNDELQNTIGINSVASCIIHKCLLEGTVFPIASYDEDESVRRKYVYEQAPVIDPATGMPIPDENGMPAMASTGNVSIDEETGEPVTIDVIESLFKGGRVEFADFKDMYLPDDVTDWEKTDVIRVVRMSYGDLMRKKNAKGYISENIGPWLLNLTNEELAEEPVTDDVKVTGNEQIEFLECSIRYMVAKTKDKKDEDIKDFTEERYVCLITKDTNIIVRKIKLIDLNFKNQHLIKRVRLLGEYGKTYGTSMYEKMKSIQNGATDLYNDVINIAIICMIPWFIYSDAAGLDGETTIEPGKGVKADDPSQVQFPRFNQNPRSYMPFIEMFMSLWERLGSIGDIQIGRINDTSKDVTATETLNAIQEGNVKHNYQSISIKIEFIQLLRTLYDLYYQYMPYDTTFPYKGPDGQVVPVKIPREEMERRVKFKLVGSTDMANKAINMKIMETLYNALIGSPVSDPIELTNDFVEAHNEDAPKGKYINPQIKQLLAMLQQNPELMQVIQQHLQMKQQQMGQAEQAKMDRQADIAGRSAGREIVQGTQNA